MPTRDANSSKDARSISSGASLWKTHEDAPIAPANQSPQVWYPRVDSPCGPRFARPPPDVDHRTRGASTASAACAPRSPRLHTAAASPAPPYGAQATLCDALGHYADVRVHGETYRMRWIAPSCYVRGVPAGTPATHHSERPCQPVRLSAGVWLGATPVTQALYGALTGDWPSCFREGQAAGQRPVEQVTWASAVRFCTLLQAAVAPAAPSSLGTFRLPTEAEWEVACRAGSASPQGTSLGDVAWYRDNSGGTTHPVAMKAPNEWGFYDMLGNVWGLCADQATAPPRYGRDEVTDPYAVAGPLRVYRGGSWLSAAAAVRPTLRRRDSAQACGDALGVRLAFGAPLVGGACAGAAATGCGLTQRGRVFG